VEKPSIGKYQIEEIIGSGTQGEVIKANTPVLDRTVAIKKLRKQNFSEDSRDTLIHEAKTLARLSHPNIVTLYELLQDGDEIYLVLEYIDGISLSEKLKAGPLPLSQAIQIATAIASGVAEAQASGITHGDLKPGNIMIDNAGIPRLVDFGLAKLSNNSSTVTTHASQLESSTSLEGTLPYMAPEVIMGEAFDHRSDIFSLGAVFYEILSGKRAFDATNQGAVLNRILNDTPTSLQNYQPEVPAWLDNLINEMLIKDPAERVNSAARIEARLSSQGKRDFKTIIDQYLKTTKQYIVKKRSLPQWLKLVSIATITSLIIWAGTIIARDVAPPVSVRMEQGIELVQHFEETNAVRDAQKLFSSIISEEPEHPGATAGLALALIREYSSIESDPATLRRATFLAHRAHERAPQLAIAAIAHAWAAYFNGEYEKAHQLYDHANLLDMNNPLILEGKAYTYTKQNNYEKALKTFEQGIKLHKNERIFYDEYGSLLLNLGRIKEAEKAFRSSITVNPDSVYGYANLAHTLHMQGNTQSAVTTIQDGLKVKSHSILYNNLGNYLFFLGEYEQSAQAFERTIQFGGNSHEYLYWANVADAYRWAPGREKKASAAYKRAIQLIQQELKNNANDPTLNSRAALYASKTGDSASAKKFLKVALAPPVKQTTIYYRATLTYEILGDRANALKFLTKAIERGYPLIEIKNDPELTNLRRDVLYHELLSKVGDTNEQ